MRRALGLVVLIVMTVGLSAYAQDDAGVLKKWDFEDGLQGWQTLDPQAKLAVTAEEDAVYAGKQSLELMYRQRLPKSAKPEDIPGVAIVELEGLPEGTKSLRFTVATGYSVPVIVALRERTEALYIAPVWSEVGDWNPVQLSLADFTLSGDGPKDDNNQLDPDQVQYIAIADGSLFGRALAQQGIPIRVPEAAEVGIWLDEVILSSEEPDDGADPLPEEGAEEFAIDSGSSKTIHWLPLGGDNVSLLSTDANGDSLGYLDVSFVNPARTIFAIMRNVSPGMLDGCKKLSFEVNSELPAMVAVALQQADQSRFMVLKQLKGGHEWQQIEVAFSEFTAQPGQQGGGRPDPAQTTQIGFADVLGMMQNVMSANTWQIRKIKAHR